MPFPDKYRSTGRPPGKFHIRHSPKNITENLESPSPPFDIFSIDLNNYNRNNNNYSIIYYNGGIVDVNTDADIKDGGLYGTRRIGRVGNNSNTNVVGHRSNRIDTWLTDRFQIKHKYKFNIDDISTTTTTTTTAPATPAIATINYKTSTEGIPNEGGEDAEAAAGLSEWFADRFESNRCNYKYKFNIDGISTTTIAPATPAISNEDGEAGLSEWFANLFESNRCNSISNNNNSGSISTSTSTNKDKYNETSHHFFLFKLISLYLIITKSFSSNTKEPKEKHHHQQQQEHYHAKDRHQFHLEQQQKHQYFKQQHHNVERMAASIVLKLTLVAWDMWTYRNGF
jgi:hypothetical protein